MRSFEILLSLSNLLIFCLLALPLPRGVLWLRYWVLIAVLIAVVQVLVEGARWQMLPAYALTGLFFLVWLLQHIAPASWPANRLVVGLAVSLGVLGLAIASAHGAGAPRLLAARGHTAARLFQWL